jgi:hypothetical protein
MLASLPMRVVQIFLLVLGSASLVACGADDEPAGTDAGPGDPDATPACSPGIPELSPAWLRSYEEGVVAKLSGAQEIANSITLSDRFSAIRRGQAQLFIEEELAAMGYEVQRDDYGNGTNVFVELEGSEESLIVLGAHYDSVEDSPGANDNATGVAAVLAAARFLKDQDCRVHDVIFVLFDQEELDLLGSDGFAQKLRYDSRDVRAVYTLDQLGWDMDADRTIEIESPAPGMLAQVQATIDRHGLGIQLSQTNVATSDHQSFRDLGFAALGVTEEFVGGDTTPHYHLPTDTYETVDFGFLESASALVNGLVFDRSIDI